MHYLVIKVGGRRGRWALFSLPDRAGLDFSRMAIANAEKLTRADPCARFVKKAVGGFKSRHRKCRGGGALPTGEELFQNSAFSILILKFYL